MSLIRRAERRNFRVVVMGSSGVGKTAIINRFLYMKFPEKYIETVEELYHHVVSFEAMTVEIDILDTSGSHEFPAMHKLAISTGDAFLLVYSVDKKDSFENVRMLKDEVKELKQEEDCFVLIIANKSDLARKESCDQAVNESIVCLEWEEKFFETSAKTGENINSVFQSLEEHIKEKIILEGKMQPLQRRISVPTVKFTKQLRHKKASPLKLKSRSYSAD